MASLLAEGGFATLSGTWSSTSPATLADFRKAGRQAPLDGQPANIYTVHNGDDPNNPQFLVWVQINGLNTTNSTTGTGTQGVPIWPGADQSFQLGNHPSEIQLVQAWLTTTSNGTTSSSCTITGGVIGRR